MLATLLQQPRRYWREGKELFTRVGRQCKVMSTCNSTPQHKHILWLTTARYLNHRKAGLQHEIWSHGKLISIKIETLYCYHASKLPPSGSCVVPEENLFFCLVTTDKDVDQTWMSHILLSWRNTQSVSDIWQLHLLPVKWQSLCEWLTITTMIAPSVECIPQTNTSLWPQWWFHKSLTTL